MFHQLVMYVAVAWIPPQGAPPPAQRGTIRFEDASDAAQVVSGGRSFGASVGDFDSDGWPDLFVGNHYHGENTRGSVSLFRNRGDGTFAEVAATTFEGLVHGDLHGSAWADFDDDGDEDLFVATGADYGTGRLPKLFYVNDAKRGKLVESAVALGLDLEEARGRTPLWLPWDRDASLELLLTALQRPDGGPANSLFRRDARGIFANVTEALGLDESEGCMFAQFSRLDDPAPRVLLYPSGAPGPRILDLAPQPARPLAAARAPDPVASVADAVVADFDGDGMVELFLGRYGVGTELLHEKPEQLELAFSVGKARQEVRFRCASPKIQVHARGNRVLRKSIHVGTRGRPPAALDFEVAREPAFLGPKPPPPMKSKDSDRVLSVDYDAASDRWRVRVESRDWWGPLVTVEAKLPIEEVECDGFEPAGTALPPVLWRRGRDRSWIDATKEADLDEPLAVRSVAGADFDDDGDVDLFVVQGNRLRDLPDLLLLNRGDGKFVRCQDSAGAGGDQQGAGDTAVVLDYDRNGFPDLFVTNGEGDAPRVATARNRLFRNLGNKNHWLEIDLVGTRSGREAIGAQVRLTVNGRTQVREQSGGMHRYAQDSRRIHFGLGPAREIEQLVVRWPSGATSTRDAVSADQVIQIREP